MQSKLVNLILANQSVAILYCPEVTLKGTFFIHSQNAHQSKGKGKKSYFSVRFTSTFFFIKMVLLISI